MGEMGQEQKKKNKDGVRRREELVIFWERICHWRGGDGTEHGAGMRGWRSGGGGGGTFYGVCLLSHCLLSRSKVARECFVLALAAHSVMTAETAAIDRWDIFLYPPLICPPVALANILTPRTFKLKLLEPGRSSIALNFICAQTDGLAVILPITSRAKGECSSP